MADTTGGALTGMRRRVPTSVRIGLLAVLLVLLSNLAVIGFVRYLTHDDALAGLRERAVEEARPLSDIAQSGGEPALRHAVHDLVAQHDPELIAATVADDARILSGNIARLPAGALRAGVQVENVVPLATGRPSEAVLVIQPLPSGWLVSGRLFGERLALQRVLERSLLLSAVLAMLLGLVGGIVVARYVGRRVAEIADVVDEVGEGALDRRVTVGAVADRGDAFDRLARRINRMLDRVVALMSELTVLTDSLAHDLRSPVGRLRTRIERALTTTDEAQRDAMLAGVIQEADALMRVLGTVLEIGRVEAMASRRNFAGIEPGGLIDELAEMYEPLAEEAGVALATRRRGAGGGFVGHRQLLAQSLSNLLDNALGYGAEGGHIDLFAEVRGETLHLGVADRGRGILPADLAEARRRFGRLDSSRSSPGAGLGLALVEAVAHLHGGRLELSDNKPGLRAALVLPLRGAG